MNMSIDTAANFLQGAIMVCAFVSSLYFLRFWKDTHDSLFAYFAASFFLLGLVRICLTFSPEEAKTGLYWLRFLGFLLIIFAIIDKNRPGRK
jgi:uncharacterized membrane protein HdeD (DUF308 family)